MNFERNEAQEYGGNGEHATLYATNKPIAADTYTALENAINPKSEAETETEAALEAAASQRVRELPSFKRTEKPLNTGHAHACSNPELGEFIGSESIQVSEAAGVKKYCTQFIYEYGIVILDSDWKWVTCVAKKITAPEFHDGDKDNYRDFVRMYELADAATR